MDPDENMPGQHRMIKQLKIIIARWNRYDSTMIKKKEKYSQTA